MRIKVLDSFRGIAILMVICFHYFSRWTSLYYYGDKYDYFPYGNMGVHLFFIISGFVILYTLENTATFVVFWKKRVIRLLPAMLVASLITYLTATIFDHEMLFPTSHYFKNVLVSLTFIQPDLVESGIRHYTDLDYTSGSYWSLWPEIQFYFLISCIFFLFPKRFRTVFLVITSLMVACNFLLSFSESTNQLVVLAKHLVEIFNLFAALPYFCLGVVFFTIYSYRQQQKKLPLAMVVYALFLVIMQYFIYASAPLKFLLVLLFLLLFLLLLYFPDKIRFLENRLLIAIGFSSYFLYLIHENIGVLFINKYGSYFKNMDIALPVMIMILLCGLSILFTYKIEKRLGAQLKKWFLKK